LPWTAGQTLSFHGELGLHMPTSRDCPSYGTTQVFHASEGFDYSTHTSLQNCNMG